MLRSAPRSAHLMAVLCLAALPAFGGQLRVAAIDVGQGDAMVVVAPGGCVALFDGGPTGSGADIKAYLASIGATRIDLAFLSHFHADHLGGIDEVDVGTGAVPITAVYDRGGSYSTTAFSTYASHFSGRRFTATLGQTWSLCNEVTLQVVAVNGNGLGTTDENALSLVIKVSYGAFDALIGGDVTSSPNVESRFAASVGEVELYKVHHHGSASSSSATLLDVLLPTVAFISVGATNNYGHPSPDALSRLAARGAVVWQTEDPASGAVLGNIVLTSADGATYQVAQGTRTGSYLSKGAAPTPDTTPPTTPTQLTATATDSQVSLSWTASTDDVRVTGYGVSRSTDGANYVEAGTTGSTGFADLGLSPSTTYWYQVRAFDLAGNVSAPAAVSVATLAPSLTLTSPNGGESWAGGSSHDITWASSFVSSVSLDYSLDDGASWTAIASGVSASAGRYGWTAPNVTSATVRVRVAQSGGGLSDQSDAAFALTLTANQGPARVAINEVLANEVGAETAGEFVELVNVGGQSISIAGWQLRIDRNTRHTFAANTTLAPGQAIVVFAGAAAIPAGLSNAVPSSSGQLGLGNGGGEVALRDLKRNVDVVKYGAALGAQDGVSMNLSPDATADAPLVLHDTLSGLLSSPGRRADGSAF